MTDLGITRERFPNLRTLQVAHTPIPSLRDPSFYTQLRRLSLTGCPFKSTLEQFVQLLSHSPGLEHLELDNFLQQLSDSGNAGPPRSLPSLRFLRLDNHSPMCSAAARFLSQIIVPAASLSITVDVDSANEDAGVKVDDTLCAIIPPNVRSSLPQFANVTRGRLKVTLEHCTVECHPTEPEPGEPVLVTHLALTSPTGSSCWEGDLSHGISDFLMLFGSAPLTHLEVAGYCDSIAAGTDAWASLFRTFPSLVSLEADGDDMAVTGLLEASLASPADGPVVCQGLECITLNDEWGNLPVTLTGPDQVAFAFDPLVRCLRYRADRGARFKELRLELHRVAQAAVREKYLPQLESLVQNIIFGNAWTKNDR